MSLVHDALIFTCPMSKGTRTVIDRCMKIEVKGTVVRAPTITSRRTGVTIIPCVYYIRDEIQGVQLTIAVTRKLPNAELKIAAACVRNREISTFE